MKNFTRFGSCFRIALTAILSVFSADEVSAQLPCMGPNELIYLQNGTSLYNLDPQQPISGTNPVLNTITLPAGTGGLAVGPNINGPGPSPTFYVTVGGTYRYWDGATWVNTGHTAGAINPGAGGGFIYSLEGGGGNLYKYDGTANAILLMNIAGFAGGGPYDVCVDNTGNFYILKTSLAGPGQYLNKYDPAGTLLQSWTVTGAPSTTAGGGFAIICDTVYYHNNNTQAPFTGGQWIKASIGATTLTVNNIANGFIGTAYSPSDVGSCPIGGGINPVQASIDTGYYCGYGPGVPVSAMGTGPFTWTVISGNAVVNGSGPSVTLTATSGISKIVLGSTATSTSACNNTNGTDTITLIVPTGTVDAGPDYDTIIGCGTYSKVLNGQLYNTTPGLTYTVAWTPPGSIISGANTLTPTIGPTGFTTYILTATANGCTFQDSIKVSVVDSSVQVDFSHDVNWGCGEDTVYFTTLSSVITNHVWDFNDNNIRDTGVSVSHIYKAQGIYNVKLVVSNGYCTDSITKPIDLLHPLDAIFSVDDDSVCQGQLVTFADASITTTKNNISPTWYWDFGDGFTSTLQNPTHVFNKTGVFNVMQVVTDFVPCSDTAWHIIVVDSIPHAHISISDSVLCEGQGVLFNVDYLTIGNTATWWEFGDGTVIYNKVPTLHAYDTAGIFTIKFNASYRICNDTSDEKVIEIRPFPVIDLGNDTTMCPNGEPIMITDKLNSGNGSAKWLWNTGETTPSILVRHHGVYSATVTIGKCTTTDSVEVFKNCYLDIPNSFTPNGDGMNDYFLPRQLLSLGVVTFRMQIFNRWGQLIFETTSLEGRGWDGKFNDKDQPQGVFVYLIEAEFLNGSREKYQGNVTLLR